MSTTEEKPESLLKKVEEKTAKMCTINMEEKPLVSDATIEKTDTFLTKTGDFLHKAADATIFTKYGNYVDGFVEVDGALSKDIVHEVKKPFEHEKEDTA